MSSRLMDFLTIPFDETIYARIRRDPEFAVALVKELEAEIHTMHERYMSVARQVFRGME